MVTAAKESALDHPVWSALTTGDRRFAEGGPLALRFPADIAPFAATVDDSPEAFAALRELISPEGRVALVTLDKLKPYPGLEVVREAPIVQMIARRQRCLCRLTMPKPIVLGAADVPEMLDLATRTNPAPLVRARTSSASTLAFGSMARSPPWLASACGSMGASRSAQSA